MDRGSTCQKLFGSCSTYAVAFNLKDSDQMAPQPELSQEVKKGAAMGGGSGWVEVVCIWVR